MREASMVTDSPLLALLHISCLCLSSAGDGVEPEDVARHSLAPPSNRPSSHTEVAQHTPTTVPFVPSPALPHSYPTHSHARSRHRPLRRRLLSRAGTTRPSEEMFHQNQTRVFEDFKFAHQSRDSDQICATMRTLRLQSPAAAVTSKFALAPAANGKLKQSMAIAIVEASAGTAARCTNGATLLMHASALAYAPMTH